MDTRDQGSAGQGDPLSQPVREPACPPEPEAVITEAAGDEARRAADEARRRGEEAHRRGEDGKRRAGEGIDMARQGARERFEKAGHAARQGADKLRATTREQTDAAMRWVRDEGQNVLDAQRSRLAEKLTHVAAACQQSAERFHNEGDHALADWATAFAQRGEDAARYFKDRNAGDMLEDLRAALRGRSDLTLGGMFVAGLALARFLKASAPRPRGDRPWSDRESLEAGAARRAAGEGPSFSEQSELPGEYGLASEPGWCGEAVTTGPGASERDPRNAPDIRQHETRGARDVPEIQPPPEAPAMVDPASARRAPDVPGARRPPARSER